MPARTMSGLSKTKGNISKVGFESKEQKHLGVGCVSESQQVQLDVAAPKSRIINPNNL